MTTFFPETIVKPFRRVFYYRCKFLGGFEGEQVVNIESFMRGLTCEREFSVRSEGNSFL